MEQSPNVVLTVLDCLDYERPFGAKGLNYATFLCSVDGRPESIQVAVSHPALQAKKVNINLLSKFKGSILTAITSREEDQVTKVVTIKTGRQRVDEILDGTLINPRTGKPSSLLMLNKANCLITVGDDYFESTMDLVSHIESKVIVLNQKEQKAESARKLAESNKARYEQALAKASAKTETKATPVAELDTNDEESPF